MSAQYLVPCSCGHENTVAASQAGQRIACACGKMLDVPPMRRLAHMARVEDAASAAAPAPIWSVARGLFFLGLVIAVPSFAMAGYLHFNRPQVNLEAIRQETEDQSLLETWYRFGYYAQQGLPKHETQMTASLRAQGNTVQSYINIGVGIGLVGVVVAASSIVFRSDAKRKPVR